MSESDEARIGLCATPPPARGAFRHPMPVYLELFKARLTGLVLLTTAVGYAVGATGRIDPGRLLLTLLGTGLAAAGANAFNQWREIARDARMERTRRRPLPTGRLSPGRAFCLAALAVAAGLSILVGLVNVLTAALALLVVLLYVLVYTPLKARTPLCTLVGAVCGAIPPMMGWTGAAGSLGYGAWILGAVLFLWQIPHFLALAWLYREDYDKGGFRMLPSVDASGQKTGTLAVLYTLALLPLVVVALMTGMAGWVFLAGGLILALAFFSLSLRLYRLRTERSARLLFVGSILFLPLFLGLMVADRGPARGLERLTGAGIGPLEFAPQPPARTPAQPHRDPAGLPTGTSSPEAGR